MEKIHPPLKSCGLDVTQTVTARFPLWESSSMATPGPRPSGERVTPRDNVVPEAEALGARALAGRQAREGADTRATHTATPLENTSQHVTDGVKH